MSIRVLVVDDSALIRRFICDAIDAETGMEVVATAVNGKDALAKLEELPVDIVTMDIEMPVLSGLETLPELRRRHPNLPVIMFSTLTVGGAQATLDALALGASDFVTKPSGPGGLAHAVERVRADLIPKVEGPGARQPASPRRAAPTCGCRPAPSLVSTASSSACRPVGRVRSTTSCPRSRPISRCRC